MEDGLEKELAEFETGYNETAPPATETPAPESAQSAPDREPTGGSDRQPSDAAKEAPKPEVAATDLAVEPILGEPVDVLSQTITLPDNPLYGKLAGKKVTKQELLESGQLDKILTREHQELYAQELYKQQLEANRALRAQLDEVMSGARQPPGPQVGPAPGGELNPEYVKAQAEKIEQTMLPLAKKFAEMGGVEDDFVELYPKMATNYAHQVASQAQVNQFVMRTLQNVVRWIGEKHTGEVRGSSQDNFGREVSELVKKGDLFQPLADDEGRDAFVDWLCDDENPLPYKDMDFSKFSGQVIESAYYDFLRSPAGRKYHPANRTPAGKPSRAMLASAGGGTGGRAGRGSGPPMSELEKLEKEYLQATDHD